MSGPVRIDRTHELEYRYYRGHWRWYMRSCETGRFRLADVDLGERVTVACACCGTVVCDWAAA